MPTPIISSASSVRPLPFSLAHTASTIEVNESFESSVHSLESKMPAKTDIGMVIPDSDGAEASVEADRLDMVEGPSRSFGNSFGKPDEDVVIPDSDDGPGDDLQLSSKSASSKEQTDTIASFTTTGNGRSLTEDPILSKSFTATISAAERAKIVKRGATKSANTSTEQDTIDKDAPVDAARGNKRTSKGKGVGRSSGSDPLTKAALQNEIDSQADDDYTGGEPVDNRYVKPSKSTKGKARPKTKSRSPTDSHSRRASTKASTSKSTVVDLDDDDDEKAHSDVMPTLRKAVIAKTYGRNTRGQTSRSNAKSAQIIQESEDEDDDTISAAGQSTKARLSRASPSTSKPHKSTKESQKDRTTILLTSSSPSIGSEAKNGDEDEEEAVAIVNAGKTNNRRSQRRASSAIASVSNTPVTSRQNGRHSTRHTTSASVSSSLAPASETATLSVVVDSQPTVNASKGAKGPPKKRGKGAKTKAKGASQKVDAVREEEEEEQADGKIPNVIDDEATGLAANEIQSKQQQNQTTTQDKGKSEAVEIEKKEEYTKAASDVEMEDARRRNENSARQALPVQQVLSERSPNKPEPKEPKKIEAKAPPKKRGLAAIIEKTNKAAGFSGVKAAGLSKKHKIISLHRNIQPPKPKPPLPKSKRKRPDSDDDGEEFITPAEAARRKRVKLGLESEGEEDVLEDTKALRAGDGQGSPVQAEYNSD